MLKIGSDYMIRSDGLKDRSPRATGVRSWTIMTGILMMCVVSVSATQHVSTKWAVLASLAPPLVLAMPFIAHRRGVLVYLFFLFVCFPINYHLFYQELDLFLPVKGITLDLFFVPLCILGLTLLAKTATGNAELHIFSYQTLVILVALVLSAFGLSKSLLSPIHNTGIFYSGLICMVVYLIMSNVLNSKWAILFAVAGLMTATAIHAGFACAQNITGTSFGLRFLGEGESQITTNAGATITRWGGFFGGVNVLAAYLGLMLPLHVSLLFAPVARRLKLAVGISLLLGFCAETFTFSRAGWVSLAFFSMVSMYYSIAKRTNRKLFAGVFSIGLVFALSMGVLLARPDVRTRLFQGENTAICRWAHVQIAMGMIVDNISIGVGPGNYLLYARQYDYTPVTISYGWLSPVHNEYLLLAAERGVVIAILLVLLLFVTLIGLQRSIRSNGVMGYVAIGMFSGLSAWSLHCAFEWGNVFTSPLFWAYIALCVCVTRLCRTSIRADSDTIQTEGDVSS